MIEREPDLLERPAHTALGKVLDGWLLQEMLGIGGMGVVFRALHTRSGVTAALKVIHALGADSIDPLKRFRREVQALARLEHPAVVRIQREAFGRAARPPATGVCWSEHD